jgi:flagellar motor switch protein FliM
MANDRDEEDLEIDASSSIESLEREALLAGIETPAPESGAEIERCPLWEPHDFRRSSYELTGRELRSLERCFRSFAAQGTARLSEVLRASSLLELSSVSVLDWSTLRLGLPAPPGHWRVSSRSLECELLVQANSTVLVAAVERLLGGPLPEPAPTPTPPREPNLTPLEEDLAQAVLAELLACLEAPAQGCLDAGAMADLEVIEPCRSLDALEQSARDQRFLVSVYSLSLGAAQGNLYLALPADAVARSLYQAENRGLAGALRAAVEQGSSPQRSSPQGSSPQGSSPPEKGGPGAGREDSEARLLGRLGGLTTTVSAQLTTEPLCVRDLLALQPGDMIDTGVGVESPVSVKVDGRLLGEGLLTVRGERRTVRL